MGNASGDRILVERLLTIEKDRSPSEVHVFLLWTLSKEATDMPNDTKSGGKNIEPSFYFNPIKKISLAQNLKKLLTFFFFARLRCGKK